MNEELRPYSRAYEGHTGTSIERSVVVVHATPKEKQEFTYPTYAYVRKEVLVGLNRGDLRLRYPNASLSKVRYLEMASNDLKSMAALFICELVPAGIFADKLEEEQPQHAEAAAILREWERIKQQEGSK